jgi:phage head maturation protease
MELNKINWKQAIDKKELIQLSCSIRVKAEPDTSNTPKPNPVTGETILKDDEPLSIEGLANEFVQDRMNEILIPEGVILESYNKNPVLLANHSYSCQSAIGQVDMIETRENGVYFSGWIGQPQKAPLTDLQKQVRSLIAQGILKTVSVGFIPLEMREPQFSDIGEMIEPLKITKWELLEISIVPIPCNAGSIFNLKSIENGDFSKNLEPANLNDTINSKTLSEEDRKQMDELLKEIVTALQRVEGMCQQIMEAVKPQEPKPEEPVKPEETEQEGCDKPKKEEDEDKEEMKALRNQIASQEKSLAELAKVVSLIAARLSAGQKQ